MIKKRDLTRLLTDGKGTYSDVERVLGLASGVVANWPVDDWGRLTNPKHYDLVAAVLWRQRFLAMLKGQMDPDAEELPWELLMDLATPPQG